MSSLLAALGCAAVFVQGVVRDQRIGEPVLRIDFPSAGEWTSTRFRVWGAGPRTLSMSSVNQDPQFVGAELEAAFEVAVVHSDGRTFFQRAYPPGSTGHQLPSNYGDSRLEKLVLDDWPWRSWELKARVLQPDARFRTARSEIRLWKDRYDPGMGGLVNYVMIIPAAVLLLLALGLAALLARRGRPRPLVVTLVLGAGVIALFAGL